MKKYQKTSKIINGKKLHLLRENKASWILNYLKNTLSLRNNKRKRKKGILNNGNEIKIKKKKKGYKNRIKKC